MSYADGGDLSNKIKATREANMTFTEDQILDWFTQICLGLKHCHDRKILHRDLKAGNVFLCQNGLVKLGDFGIAKVLNSTVEKAQTIVGTPYYLSPEIIKNQSYDHRTDIFSLGVVMYYMAALEVPFKDQNYDGLMNKILYKQPLPF